MYVRMKTMLAWAKYTSLKLVDSPSVTSRRIASFCFSISKFFSESFGMVRDRVGTCEAVPALRTSVLQLKLDPDLTKWTCSEYSANIPNSTNLEHGISKAVALFVLSIESLRVSLKLTYDECVGKRTLFVLLQKPQSKQDEPPDGRPKLYDWFGFGFGFELSVSMIALLCPRNAACNEK
jgi:hypothetical protein